MAIQSFLNTWQIFIQVHFLLQLYCINSTVARQIFPLRTLMLSKKPQDFCWKEDYNNCSFIFVIVTNLYGLNKNMILYENLWELISSFMYDNYIYTYRISMKFHTYTFRKSWPKYCKVQSSHDCRFYKELPPILEICGIWCSSNTFFCLKCK